MIPQGKTLYGKFLSWAAYRNWNVLFDHFNAGHQCGICTSVLRYNDRCVDCKILPLPSRSLSHLLTFPSYGLVLGGPESRTF